MDPYTELLDATIAHLQTLKRGGVRYLPISQENLRRLSETKALGNAPKVDPPRTPVARSPIARPTVPAAEPAPVAKAVPPAPVVIAPSAPAPILPPGSPLSKTQALAELQERASVCVKCPNLANSRTNVVWGVGNIDANLMFIGEAPGAEEDEQGEPFVGKAGQLLTKIIQTMGLSRETVFIANILKCRPDTPGQSYGNRPPTPKEIENCLPYLHAQIDLIKPKIIVALGATSVDGLFGKVPGMGITKMRGHWREYRGIPVMPTYHPSYLLRPNPNNVKREVWEDMLAVMTRFHLPISEKQRGYFLKPG